MNKTIFILFGFLTLTASGAFSQEEVGIVFPESVYRTIVVDGNVDDWDGIEPAYIDSVGDSNGSAFDFGAVYLANDNDYFYMRISFAEPAPFGDFGWLVNIPFNTDLDAGTGFGFAGLTGSEFFVQAGAIFDQRSGANFVDVPEQSADNNWGAFASAAMAPFAETMDVEISVRRDLTYSNDENGLPGLLNPDGAPLFEFPDFIVLFEAEDPSFNSVEFMPNPDPAGGEAGLLYEFAPPPAAVDSWSIH